MGEGKNQMVVSHRKQFLHALFQPLLPVFVLTIGAVAISATVVGFVMMRAVITSSKM